MMRPLAPAAAAAEHSPKRHLPFVTALFAVVVDVLPLPSAAPTAVAPLFTVCVLFYWTLFEPALMSPLRTFLVGLLFDLFSGLPPGHSATPFLGPRLLLAPSQPSLRAQPFAVIWVCFAFAAALVELLRWTLSVAWWGTLFSPTPVLDELLLTIAVYPAISYLLSRVRARLPRPRYGDRV